MRLIFSLATFCLLFYSEYASAQISLFEQGLLYWTGIYGEYKISDRFQIDGEIDNRRFFSPSNQYQSIGRTTIYFKKSKQLNFGLGIAYSALYSLYSDVVQPEIRPHQEVNYNYGEGKWQFNHRVRIEQRFVGDTTRTFTPNNEIIETNESSYGFTIRTRYELAADLSLLDKNREGGHVNFQLKTEVMVNDSLKEFLNTTRIYAGLQYFLTDWTRLELGYLKSTEKEYDFGTLFSYDNIRFTYRQRLR